MEKRISKAVKLKGTGVLIGCGTSVNQLSLEAKKAIQSCDAVLYDRLIDERVLRLVLASKIFVGKTPGESQKQGETNKLLFKLAKKGKTVGRLKAGDALLFSRGCEEKRFSYHAIH
ncbi:MAG: SAM-dependent methyltransferase [Candidatus Micrarchaeia archaeon]